MTHPPGYPDSLEGATACLTENADPAVMVQISKLAADGTGMWIPDPEIKNVWGFVNRDNPHRALVIVYTADGDFECSDDFLEGMYR